MLKRPAHTDLGSKGEALLRVIVEAIQSGRIQKRLPETFLTYSEALHLLGDPQDGPVYTEGTRLQYHGLTDLNEWCMATAGIPRVTGLIVNSVDRLPGRGYVESDGYKYADMAWLEWWLEETDKAIDFDWAPYL